MRFYKQQKWKNDRIQIFSKRIYSSNSQKKKKKKKIVSHGTRAPLLLPMITNGLVFVIGKSNWTVVSLVGKTLL